MIIDSFCRIFIKTYVVFAHKNRLTEAILMSTYNIGFYEELTKIILQISSNTHIFSSSDPTWKLLSLSGLVIETFSSTEMFT